MNNFIKIILLNFLFSSVTFAECKGNCKDGFGSYDWGNQGIYEGNWKNGVFNGEGMFDWRNGEKYVGNFNNGNMHGKGTMTYSTGNIILKMEMVHSTFIMEINMSANGKIIRWKEMELILKVMEIFITLAYGKIVNPMSHH